MSVADRSAEGSAARLQLALEAVGEALDPAGATLGLQLLTLRSVIEANQVRRR